MTKDLTNIIKDGFELWKKNLILGAPPLLNCIISSVLGFGFLMIMLFAVLGFGFGTGFFENFENFENINDLIGPLITISIIGGVILFFMVVIIMLINSFFTAGLIGMSKEAIETGKTEISTMIECGKRKFMSLFFADLIVAAIIFLPVILIGIISLILLASGHIDTYNFIDNSPESAVYLIMLFFVITLVWFLYALIPGIILAVVNYAVVISDTGAVEGVKTAFRFFMDHKTDVFLMWLIIMVIGLVFGAVYFMIYMVLNFIPLIGAIFSFIFQIIFYAFMAVVVTPLTALWWSWLYLDREGMCDKYSEFSGKI